MTVDVLLVAAAVLYRLSTDWAHTPYIATVQVYFIGLNTASLAARGRLELGAVSTVVTGIVGL